MSNSKVIIIGFNVVGLLAAVSCAQAGHQVVLVGPVTSSLRVYVLTTYDINVLTHILGGDFVEDLIEEGVMVFDKSHQHWHIHISDLEHALLKAIYIINEVGSGKQKHIGEIQVYAHADAKVDSIEAHDDQSVKLTMTADGQEYGIYVDYIIGADGYMGNSMHLVNQNFKDTDHKRMSYTSIEKVHHYEAIVNIPKNCLISRIYSFTHGATLESEVVRDLFKAKANYRWEPPQLPDKPTREELKAFSWQKHRTPLSKCCIGPRGVYLQVECPDSWPYQMQYSQKQYEMMSDWMDTVIRYHLPKSQIDSIHSELHFKTKIKSSMTKPHILNRKLVPLDKAGRRVYLSLGELACVEENPLVGKSLDTYKIKMIDTLVRSDMAAIDFENYRRALTLKQKVALENLAKEVIDAEDYELHSKSLFDLHQWLKSLYGQLSQRDAIRFGKHINEALLTMERIQAEADFEQDPMSRHSFFMRQWYRVKEKLDAVDQEIPKRKGLIFRKSNPHKRVIKQIIQAYEKVSIQLQERHQRRILIDNYRLDDKETKQDWDRVLKSTTMASSHANMMMKTREEPSNQSKKTEIKYKHVGDQFSPYANFAANRDKYSDFMETLDKCKHQKNGLLLLMGTVREHKSRALPHHRKLLDERLALVRIEVLHSLIGGYQNELMEGLIEELAYATPKERVEVQHRLLNKLFDAIASQQIDNIKFMMSQKSLVKRFDTWCFKEYILNMSPEEAELLDDLECAPFGYDLDILNDLYDEIITRQNLPWAGGHKPTLRKKQAVVDRMLQESIELNDGDILQFYRRVLTASRSQLKELKLEQEGIRDQALTQQEPELLKLAEMRILLIETSLSQVAGGG